MRIGSDCRRVRPRSRVSERVETLRPAGRSRRDHDERGHTIARHGGRTASRDAAAGGDPPTRTVARGTQAGLRPSRTPAGLRAAVRLGSVGVVVDDHPAPSCGLDLGDDQREVVGAQRQRHAQHVLFAVGRRHPTDHRHLGVGQATGEERPLDPGQFLEFARHPHIAALHAPSSNTAPPTSARTSGTRTIPAPCRTRTAAPTIAPDPIPCAAARRRAGAPTPQLRLSAYRTSVRLYPPPVTSTSRSSDAIAAFAGSGVRLARWFTCARTRPDRSARGRDENASSASHTASRCLSTFQSSKVSRSSAVMARARSDPPHPTRPRARKNKTGSAGVVLHDCRA